MCFFEFYGDHSFAGQHINEKHYISLFDVSPYKKGILHPKMFIELFGHLEIAELLYHGNITAPFVEQVKNGEIKCSGEGVVCKGDPLKKGYPPMMFKIKLDSWVERLRLHCKGDESLFNRLL